jgi:hypothetical protein
MCYIGEQRWESAVLVERKASVSEIGEVKSQTETASYSSILLMNSITKYVQRLGG